MTKSNYTGKNCKFKAHIIKAALKILVPFSYLSLTFHIIYTIRR